MSKKIIQKRVVVDRHACFTGPLIDVIAGLIDLYDKTNSDVKEPEIELLTEYDRYLEEDQENLYLTTFRYETEKEKIRREKKEARQKELAKKKREQNKIKKHKELEKLKKELGIE